SVSITTLEQLEQSKREKPEDWKSGNFGVVLQYSNLVMVDVDQHDTDAKNGSKSWDYIVETYSNANIEHFYPDDETSTWTLTTPGNGWHYFFSKPSDFPTRFKKGNVAPGVELHAWGATALPSTAKRMKVNERWKTIGSYKWLDIEEWAINIGTLQHPHL